MQVASRSENFDYLFKIVLIGDSAVGKTNLLSRLTRNEFIHDSKATIGVEFGTLTFRIDNDVIKAQIWDTAGQERYQAIVQAYYRGTSGAVIVYDTTNKDSLKKATGLWLSQLRDFSPNDIPIMLVGNKADLEVEREVDTQSARDEAVANGLSFFETSAMTGDNVNEAFFELVSAIHKRAKMQRCTADKKKLKSTKFDTECLKDPARESNAGCCWN